MTRWRRTSGARAATSSQATLNRPSQAARARPATIKYWLARGLAPQRTQRLIYSGADQTDGEIHYVGRGGDLGNGVTEAQHLPATHDWRELVERREGILLDEIAL